MKMYQPYHIYWRRTALEKNYTHTHIHHKQLSNVGLDNCLGLKRICYGNKMGTHHHPIHMNSVFALFTCNKHKVVIAFAFVCAYIAVKKNDGIHSVYNVTSTSQYRPLNRYAQLHQRKRERRVVMFAVFTSFRSNILICCDNFNCGNTLTARTIADVRPTCAAEHIKVKYLPIIMLCFNPLHSHFTPLTRRNDILCKISQALLINGQFISICFFELCVCRCHLRISAELLALLRRRCVRCYFEK